MIWLVATLQALGEVPVGAVAGELPHPGGGDVAEQVDLELVAGLVEGTSSAAP